MDVKGIRAFVDRIKVRRRHWLTAAAGGFALAAVVGWMAWQSHLTREAIRRADAAEQAATQARLAGGEKPRRDPAVRRSRHDDPAQIARMKQLYEEVDGLTRIQDRVDEELGAIRRIAARRAKAKAAPVLAPPGPSPSPVASH